MGISRKDTAGAEVPDPEHSGSAPETWRPPGMACPAAGRVKPGGWQGF